MIAFTWLDWLALVALLLLLSMTGPVTDPPAPAPLGPVAGSLVEPGSPFPPEGCLRVRP